MPSWATGATPRRGAWSPGSRRPSASWAVELSQYGPANTLLGVEQAARDAGYFVSIAALRSVSREAIFDAIRHFLDQSVDGIVVIVPHSGTLLALAELKPEVPVVAVGSLGSEAVERRHGGPEAGGRTRRRASD